MSKKKGEIGTFEVSIASFFYSPSAIDVSDQALMSYSQTVDDDEGDDERQVIPEDFED